MSLTVARTVTVSPTQAAPLDCPPMAQPVNSDDVREGLKAARDRGFLWHAQRNQRTVWLYGTVHAAQRAWMFPGPVVLNALRESERLALELDVLDPDIGRRLQAAIATRAHEPALPVALGRRLSAQADQACLGKGLQGIRPEMQIDLLADIAKPHRIKLMQHRGGALRVPPISGKRAKMRGFRGRDCGGCHKEEATMRDKSGLRVNSVFNYDI